MTISPKISQNNGICGSIGCGTNNKTRISTSIGMLFPIIFMIITRSITQHNITNISGKKWHAITICEQRAFKHAARVCWDKIIFPV